MSTHAAIKVWQKRDVNWASPAIFGIPAEKIEKGNHGYFTYPAERTDYPIINGKQGNPVKYTIILEANKLLKFKTKDGNWFMIPAGIPYVRAQFQSKEDAEKIFSCSAEQACKNGYNRSGEGYGWRKISDTVYTNCAEYGYGAGEIDNSFLNDARSRFDSDNLHGELMIEKAPLYTTYEVTNGTAKGYANFEQGKPGKY